MEYSQLEPRDGEARCVFFVRLSVEKVIWLNPRIGHVSCGPRPWRLGAPRRDLFNCLEKMRFDHIINFDITATQ
jgi:hypothetical protein